MAKLLTPEQAAEYLGICRAKLYIYKAQGHIPFCRMGRSVRFRTEDLDAFVQGRMEGGEALAKAPSAGYLSGYLCDAKQPEISRRRQTKLERGRALKASS
jgi:excisionase family DNA binding protein